ncbi:MAG: hypothetical protein H6Q05_3347 [Acidobacteria bacterium]|jgi:hypothetical protein|nr:hypothetical protein [Acidobacteriota bacterium]
MESLSIGIIALTSLWWRHEGMFCTGIVSRHIADQEFGSQGCVQGVDCHAAQSRSLIPKSALRFAETLVICHFSR